MSTISYINGRVLVAGEFNDELTVVSKGDRILKIVSARENIESDTRVVDLAGHYLLPGFIDVQVNGGGGILFNDQTTPECIRRIAEAHRPFGTTGLLPTLISDDMSVVQQALAAAEQAILQGVPGILGIHLEGPFLNEARHGAHDPRKLRRLTRELADRLTPLSNGPTVLTLAPETVEPELIADLTRKGFIVCGGHSEAHHADVERAVQFGMRGVTHLYNAMSQLTSREPGMAGHALVDTDIWCGIIADGYHVSATSLEIARRCKGPEKLMLVTDAMSPVGSAQHEFLLNGDRVTVKDGVCVDKNGTLAGTALDMASAVRNMVNLTHCSLAEACIMASGSPATFLGIDDQRGSIKVGHFADFVVMDKDLSVISTVISGQPSANRP